MKKTIETKEVLAAIAVAQQAITAANSNIETALHNKTAGGEDIAAAQNCLNAAYLELQILVDNICDDEDDETHEIVKVKASIYKDFVERELWGEAEIKKTFEHIRHTGYVYDRQRTYKEFSVFDKDGNCKILIAK